MAETALADDGTRLPLADLTQTFNSTGNLVTSITVQYTSAFTGALRTFTQTLTYSGNQITSVSRWIAS